MQSARTHRRRGWTWNRVIALGTLLLAAAFAGRAEAGGGPENLFLVVNSRSWASLTVANHFIQLRKVPPGNVLYVDWGGDIEMADVAAFREHILARALSTIRQRAISSQIDYLVYSSDFPFAINMRQEAARLPLPEQLPPIGSLTGLTFFYGPVQTFSPLAIGVTNNRYFQPDATIPTGTKGFRGWYGWGTHGELLEAGGDQYLLSTMLAYTSGRGNSVPEAVQYLQRSAAADGTKPAGTIYFMQNSDLRSSVRHAGFATAAETLKQLGVAAEVLEGTLPVRKNDVQGAVIGTASFDWAGSGSTIRPGAICEHFTSFGGILYEGAGQTPLTEFLRYGAAGASGTVVEPFAIPEKFPSPMLQVHYARGCSLAESFYQSVRGPYQLLIVGDPLCQPWAEAPRVEVTGVMAGATLKGEVSISAAMKGGPRVDRFELFVDGLRVAVAAVGETLPLDTARLADGYHELRIVAIAASTIETQGRVILPVTVNNTGRSLELTLSARKAVWGQPLKLTAATRQADRILFFQNGRAIGKIDGPSGSVELDPRTLGDGPMEIRAFAIGAGGPTDRVAAAPVMLTVEPGRFLPEQRLAGLKLADGMSLKPAGEGTTMLQDALSGDTFAKAGVKAKQAYQLSGIFQASREDVYQFQVRFSGSLRLDVDGVELFRGEDAQGSWYYVPAALSKGPHRLSLTGVAGEKPLLGLKFGNRGTASVTGKMLQHLP